MGRGYPAEVLPIDRCTSLHETVSSGCACSAEAKLSKREKKAAKKGKGSGLRPLQMARSLDTKLEVRPWKGKRSEAEEAPLWQEAQDRC